MGELQNTLSADKKILVDWLSKPKTARSTQKELAEKIGVTSATISNWKQEPDIVEATYKRKRQLIKAEDIPEILDAIIKEAKKGKVKQAKLIMEWAGEIDGKNNPGNAVQVNINTGIPRNEDDIVDVDVEEGDT